MRLPEVEITKKSLLIMLRVFVPAANRVLVLHTN